MSVSITCKQALCANSLNPQGFYAKASMAVFSHV
jgi:hypothetical protein